VVSRLARLAALLLISSGSTVAHATHMDCSERLLSPAPAAATGQRSITARDLVEIRDFGRWDSGPTREPFSVSPDGRFAALTLRRADRDSDSYCIGVVLISLDGNAPPRLLDVGGELIPGFNDLHGVPAISAGTIREATPVWSPDGRQLAFLRRDGRYSQIWTVGLEGGAARRVTDLNTEILSANWALDGKLIFTTRRSLDAGLAAIEAEGRSGFLYDERFWALTDNRPRPRLPLPAETNLLDLSNGTVRQISTEEATSLAWPNQKGRPVDATQFASSQSGYRAWITLADPRRPLGGERLHLANGEKEIACDTTICGERIAGIWWSAPDELLILRSGGPKNGGTMAMFRWRPTIWNAPRLMFNTQDWLTGCHLAGGNLFCALETGTHPRTLVRLDWKTGKRRVHFDPNPEFAAIRHGKVERLRWTGPDGAATYGDLVLPPEHRPGERHPLIVVQYISRGFLRGGTGDEYPIFLLAQHGFAVLSFQMPTMLPQVEAAASVDAGQREAVAGWAGRQRIFNALDRGIDAVIERGVVDPKRIGITGMSDGASTVQYALLNADRFRAAAISSCCDDPSTMFSLGPSYEASAARWGYPKAGDDGRDFWARQSLALNAARLQVPLLMQLPDGEFRMAGESYSALKSHGAPVEMYVFPGEYHTKTHPAHRLAIYSRNLAWFDFWLQGIEPVDRPAERERWVRMRDRLSARQPAEARTAPMLPHRQGP